MFIFSVISQSKWSIFKRNVLLSVPRSKQRGRHKVKNVWAHLKWHHVNHLVHVFLLSPPFSYTHDTEHRQCMKTIILNSTTPVLTIHLYCWSITLHLWMQQDTSEIVKSLSRNLSHVLIFCHLSYCPNLHANFTITPSNEPDLALIQRSGVCEHHPQLGQGH